MGVGATRSMSGLAAEPGQPEEGGSVLLLLLLLQETRACAGSWLWALMQLLFHGIQEADEETASNKTVQV